MGSFSSLRRTAIAAGFSFAMLSGIGGSLASASDFKDKKPFIEPPKPVCKAVPLPSALPAGLALFGVVGVIAYRERRKEADAR